MSQPRHEMIPSDIRQLCRHGHLREPTAGLARGFVQANLVILPSDLASDFESFCNQNPAPCPLLEVTSPGDPYTKTLADAADLRTDLPRYRVFENGLCVAEPTDIRERWRDDLVAFLLGCSFTFESALQSAGLRLRHIELGCNVPMYRTNILCTPAGRFRGPLVVSMRPFAPREIPIATRITSQFPSMHGGPVHVGDSASIGISDLQQPDWGDVVPVGPGEVPVFWACGVTPQAVLLDSKPPFAITHAPGHMFVSDRRDDEYRNKD